MLRGFIQDHVSPADIHTIDSLTTAHLMFEKLRSEHEKQGAFAQVNLLLKALKIDLTYEKSIHDSIAELRTYYQRFLAMGDFKPDNIFTVMLLNFVNKNFGPLQQTINSMSSSTNFNSKDIVNRLLDEDTLIRHHIELGQPANPYTLNPSSITASAFAAISSRSRSPCPFCANCKHKGHGTDFCIACYDTTGSSGNKAL